MVAVVAAMVGMSVLAAQEDSFDVAVLDVDLNGKDAYPAADVLEDRGIPFVFHTGHGTKRELRASYPTAPVIKKPTPPEVVRSHARSRRGSPRVVSSQSRTAVSSGRSWAAITLARW